MSEVYGVAFSPDGCRLATASGNKTAVWDVSSGRELAIDRGNIPVYGVAFSPDGNRLAVAGSGGARIWVLSDDE